MIATIEERKLACSVLGIEFDYRIDEVAKQICMMRDRYSDKMLNNTIDVIMEYAHPNPFISANGAISGRLSYIFNTVWDVSNEIVNHDAVNETFYRIALFKDNEDLKSAYETLKIRLSCVKHDNSDEIQRYINLFKSYYNKLSIVVPEYLVNGKYEAQQLNQLEDLIQKTFYGCCKML